MFRFPHRILAVLLGFFLVFPQPHAGAEAMLQYFNTSWNELSDKMPELAEAGYNSLWVPPPTKGSGGLSVGYDLWDRFDLGSKDQRNTVSTRYGTEADLLKMVEIAHRFGIRVYFDNIMNHNAFDIPGFNADTPIDTYPGMVPEDFHLRVTSEGFYRKWDNTRNYGDAWQVQHLGLADLIDIAQEPGATNENFGTSEGSTFPKIKFVRQPNNPEYYCYLPNGIYVGFGPSNGITTAILTDPVNTNFYSERVEDFLNRSARWLLDRTKVDGLRLDAVKHVRADFFGATFGADKDYNTYGYVGQAQLQFNITRGFNDTKFNFSTGQPGVNLRESLFDTEKPRHNAMLFGEHLGEPPGYGDYLNSGMRLVDNPLRQNLNDKLGNPSNGLQGYDQPGAGGFSPETGVMHAQSHDNDYASRPELHNAFYFTRAGLGLLYTDGNNQAETLGESGGAFPRHANTNFLGQYNDPRIPNLLYIHNQFARGYQKGLQPNNNQKDPDYVAYERIDKRENPSMSDADGVTLLFLLNDNYANGLARSVSTSFPATAFTSNNAYLYNYSSYGGGFYKYASELSTVVVPPGGYFAFSWKNPDPSNLWANGGGKPLTILQNNGQPVSSLTFERKDGRDGDKAFNPYNLPDTNTTDYKYSITVPRVTNGTALSFIARTDGSAENILMELDGGIDINSQIPLGPTTGDKRDNAPGLATDTFLGFEQPQFITRIHPELFAAKLTGSRDVTGSGGAETYTTSGVVNQGNGTHFTDANTASYIYHDPVAPVDGQIYNQYDATTRRLWAKVNPVGAGYRMFVYYTTDASYYPEGAGGEGVGLTKFFEMTYQSAQSSAGSYDWWASAAMPADFIAGTSRYKIGIYKDTAGGFPISSILPSGATEVARKKNMMTVFKIPTFNATTVQFFPHNDYGGPTQVKQTGLSEGFHFLRARAFLNRPGQASIYNTFTQTFYYDAQTPQGEIKFPGSDGSTLSGQTYGVVVRGDQSVKDAWVHIDDTDTTNDDVQTKVANGNGIGFEPFVDANNDGTWNTGEAFTDLNGNGAWDNNVPAWIKVSEGTASASVTSIYPREWRFDYRNIAPVLPSGSNAGAIKVRLREISSSAKLFEVGNGDISDANGHFTTLTRTFNAAGDPQRMFIAFPSTDGQTVGEGYVMKVRFSDNLANGTDEATLKSRFVIKIASSESGSLANPVTQSTASYQIIYNASPGFHDLAFTLPNLYNGVTDFLHTIQVSLTRPTNSTLTTARQVKATPTAQGSFISIKNPPEFDSDGKRFEIILPDVAAPTAEQRQTTISVETSTDVSTVSIAFANNAGTATQTAATETLLKNLVSVTNGSAAVIGLEKQLAGTVSTVAASATISGTGTAFTAELTVGDLVRVGSQTFTVLTLTSATSLTATTNAAAPATTVASFLQPQFDQTLSTGNTIKIGTTIYTVAAINSASSLTLNSAYSGTTASNLSAYRIDPNPTIVGAKKNWTFLWTGMTPGFFTFTATAVPASGPAVTATRNATVIFRQIVTSDPNDADDDDDGLGDINETTTTALPTTNPETWVNGDVHVYYAYGHTNPLSPDSDGDGLPDALEVGWRTASNPPTNPTADTNGDGFPNFIGDIDPPFYNTLGTDYAQIPFSNFGRVPGVNSSSEGGDRAALKGGSTTNPNDPDTDHDGIMDGVEDANKNGWVDGDGEILPTNFLPYLARKWPNGKMDPGETWIETDPNIPDTDGDGLLDGYGEDKNSNGFIDGDTNKNRVYDTGEHWTETDPLKADTDGDGLPDGWEVNNGLDPLDNGTLNMRTGDAGSLANGASGDPDGDGFNNLTELTNGTDPQTPNTITPPPPGSIVIGPQNPVVVGGVTNIKEFTDWSANDLVVLDEYDGGGTNNQGGDVYHANDGYDSSRDLTAFYAHDGGDPNATPIAGDGNFYFRVDLENLLPNAEAGNLDIYVAIDSGNPAVGEYNLPDDIDTGTEMRWEAVVACYSTNNGRVYIDTNLASNSTAIGQNLSTFGVISRDQTATNGFKKAYYNSDLDSVEFSISRQALKDAGWNGDPSVLNFQVYTTKDGTNNSPTPGLGDIGGRSDIRDAIYDDFIASDYYKDQTSIAGDKSVLKSWFSTRSNQPAGKGTNDRGKRAKVALLAHANQAIIPGSQIQAKINTGAGAGYYRPLDVHEAYSVPLNLHITPTTASAIQWAKVDPAVNKPYLDGPAFNTRIRNLEASGKIDLLGTTFSDNPLPYFTTSFNADNVALSRDFLEHIYGAAPSTRVFYAPERVLDGGTFGKIASLGFTHTLVDQMRHIFKWYGRNSALGDDGYRINEINGIKTFVINDDAGKFRFQNTDNGLSSSLRELLNRKARAGQQDQVVILASYLEDFTTKANADAYDKNVRWLASRPWTQIVSLDDIAAGNLDISTPPDGNNDTWGTVTRATNNSLVNVSPDYVDHATQESYDHWYFGQSGLEESLSTKIFNIRSGAPLPQAFGQIGSNNTLLDSTWNAVQTISPLSGLQNLARITTHSALFVTAFHDQTANDLSKFSTGAYIYPDAAFQSLAGFSKNAQSQVRFAAIYQRVDAWRTAANAGTYLNSVTAETADVDLDGEPEYVLYNDRIFALFERIGGRLVGTWVRDINTGEIFQTIGNPMSYSGAETEDEGTANVLTGQVASYRTSGLKDWFAAPAGTNYVNNLYIPSTPTAGTGWKLTSSDSKVAKTVTLGVRQSTLQVSYTVDPGFSNLYIRTGLSPNLEDLLLNGQTYLSDLNVTSQELNLFNNNPASKVRAFLRIGGSGYSGTSYNAAAIDDGNGATFDTLNMRNQAQTQQVELFGANTLNFALGFETGSTISYDSDNDGLPDWWETANNLDPNSALGINGADGNPDGDGKTNIQEYILQTNPKLIDGYPPVTLGGGNVTFPTLLGRTYQVQSRDDLTSGTWQNLGSAVIGTGGSLSVNDPTASSASRRFYRLQVQLSP